MYGDNENGKHKTYCDEFIKGQISSPLHQLSVQ